MEYLCLSNVLRYRIKFNQPERASTVIGFLIVRWVVLVKRATDVASNQGDD